MSKKIKILILIFIILLTVFFDFNFLNKNLPRPPLVKTYPVGKAYGVQPPPLNKERGQGGGVDNFITLEINGTKYETKISDPVKVDALMQKLQDEGKINFKYQTYTGMGKFIEEINGIKNGEKNWIYYVNNVRANVGVSNYQIKNGDIISWKYEKNY